MQYTNSKFQIGYQTDQCIIWQDDYTVIDLFKKHNLYLNFYYGNIFLETNINLEKIRQQFFKAHTCNGYFNASDLFVKIKYLSDSFLVRPPKTVFCLKETPNGLSITKGSKKLYAFAINNMQKTNIISLTSQPTRHTLYDDTELYNKLKILDKETNLYRLNLGWNDDIPNIQYLEDVNTLRKWGGTVQSAIVEKFQNFCNKKIKIAIKGNFDILDERLEVTSNKLADCIVTASDPVNITYENIVFNSYNFYYNRPTLRFNNKSIMIDYTHNTIY
jgi:hypothetical protein